MTCLVQPQFVDVVVGSFLTNNTSTTMRLDMVDVHNTDTSTRIFTAYIVQSGQTAGPVSIRVVATVAAGATVIVRELIGHDLSPGDSLQAVCDAALVVSLRVSGRLVPN